MSYFQRSFSYRKSGIHSPITLPLTPPDTPPTEHDIPMTCNHLSLDTNINNRRHTYHRTPSSPSSPLSLPPLLPADGQSGISPAITSALVTPVSIGASTSSAMIASDHSMLTSMTHMPPPDLINDSPDDGFPRHNFPLLPPHHPLRKQMCATLDKEGASPPHTPKGHPLDSSLSFPFNPRAKMHTITNPYSGTGSYASSLTYLVRVPRRLRPLLVVGFCFLTFGLVTLNRAMSTARHMDTRVEQRGQMASRRYVEVDALDGINIAASDRQAVLSPVNPVSIQSAISAPTANPPFAFESRKDELAALLSFITSTTANVLPMLDPSLILDPALVLDFDPSHPSARENFELLVTEINAIFPIVLFGRMRDPWLREVKKMLLDYKITPEPLVVDVDQRRDHVVFIPLLTRILGTAELPQLLLRGQSLGTYHDVLALRDAGTFRSTLEASGAVSVRDAKKKKKGVKERERIENERILGPAPIIDGI